MKNIIFILLFSVLGIIQTVHAGLDCKPKGLWIQVGPQLSYFDYHEFLTPPQKSDEYGMLYGVNLSINYLGKWLYCGASTKFYTGTITYDGAIITFINGSIAPHKQNTNAFFYDSEARIGLIFNFTPDQKNYIAIYTGIGYLFWDRDGTEYSLHSYQEQYRWLYLSVGALVELAIHKGWSIGLHPKLTQGIRGKIDSLGEQATLGNRAGFSFEIPLKHYFLLGSHRSSISITPFTQYYEFGEGNAIVFQDLLFAEPHSRTWNTGIKLEWGFGF